MNRPSFTDHRLDAAAKRIEAGDIRLLAIDIFDTLLLRRVPAPTDVFLRMGVNLKERKALGPGLRPDSFAAIRYQTEYEARGLRQRAQGDREITIEDLYAIFPPHITTLPSSSLIALEIETETELTFAHPEVVALALWAKSMGLKIALISNMYLGEAFLRPLVQVKVPNLPAPDGFFVSCDHRCGKRTGLIPKMLESLSVKPEETLMLGDNPVSDKLAAEENGLHFIFLEDDLTLHVKDEHPRQWHERTGYYALSSEGDYGLTALRRQAHHWPCPASVPAPLAWFHTYGATMMGPLLTGYAAWAAERLAEEKAERGFGLLREGALLSELVGTLAPTQPQATLAASRIAVALASFSPDYPEHLEDFLTRRGHWTLAMLAAQLGFSPEDAKDIGDPDLTLEIAGPLEMARLITASRHGETLYAKSADRRQRLMRYLASIGALSHGRLFLLDLGYAATIQRNLQRVFTIEKTPIQTHGLYMTAAHVSRLTQRAGGIVEGFLAQNGNPNDFACAFCRSPEIVELSCMPHSGMTIDYNEEGQPVFAPCDFPEAQLREMAALQHGVRDFVARFAAHNNASHPGFTNQGWEKQMRALALRLVAYPTPEEVSHLGAWVVDTEIGHTHMRPAASAGSYADRAKVMTAAELAALPRRDAPWLFGLAAALDPDGKRNLAAEVARIIMRRK